MFDYVLITTKRIEIVELYPSEEGNIIFSHQNEKQQQPTAHPVLLK